MLLELLSCLIFIMIGLVSSLLFFKYLSPKEEKDLRNERKELFKEVEKLLKNENFIDAIPFFDHIAEISEKLGESDAATEFQDRANNLRRILGQETKSYSKEKGVEEEKEKPQQPKSLMEEGLELIDRLKKIRGEKVDASPNPITPKTTDSTGTSPPFSPTNPSTVHPTPNFPPKQALTPPIEPTVIDSSSVPSIDPSVVKPLTNLIPFQKKFDENEIIEEPEELLDEDIDLFIGAEPEVADSQIMEPELTVKENQKTLSNKDEKAEIISRLEYELPYLPEKIKKNIIKELLSRPEGKLRDTWFRVFLYKNKKYARKEE